MNLTRQEARQNTSPFRSGEDKRPLQQVAPDITYLRTLIVNVYFVGSADAWVLVDTGLPYTAERVLRAAEERFGGAFPKAIILTHAHFDHVGAAGALAEHWGVPIYAHPLEMPYLTGSDYPPPDPTVGGGLMALSSPLFPHSGVHLESRVRPLSDDGSVPFMPEWRMIHTPGHTAGHVSLFRERDGVLIAGDAFVATKQESLRAVLQQRKEVHAPPAYFTPDWQRAKDAVRRLAALGPTIALTGHGLPLRGEELSRGLEALARNFDDRHPQARTLRRPRRRDGRARRHSSCRRHALRPTFSRVSDLAAAVAGVALLRRKR